MDRLLKVGELRLDRGDGLGELSGALAFLCDDLGRGLGDGALGARGAVGGGATDAAGFESMYGPITQSRRAAP